MYIQKTALCKEAQSISKIIKKREKQKGIKETNYKEKENWGTKGEIH